MEEDIKIVTVWVSVVIALITTVFGVFGIIAFERVDAENEYLEQQNEDLRELYLTQVKDYKGEYEYYE